MKVLEAVDDPAQPVHKVLGVAAKSLAPRYGEEDDDAAAAAREQVVELIARRGWRVAAKGAASEALAAALAALDRVGHGAFAGVLDDYADAAETVAHADLAYVAGRGARDDVVEGVVVGTVLGDAMLASMRRMAQTNESARLYGGERTPG
ncbi:MerR family transcriptional regulator [Streptomyces sp. A5-4]|uniref:MerR family transcriptional regulator n=1 Tax=Streptomyces sp. A5-4 TaxID=3384771 RepID=UPI003DA7F453